MSWKDRMTNKWKKRMNGEKKESEKMNKKTNKKSERKVCANVKCNNTAPADSIFCGKHRPKITKKTTSSHVSKVGCHEGNVLVFTTPDGIEVYGGGSSRGGGWWVMEPRPHMAIGPRDIIMRHQSKHEFPEGWKVADMIEHPVPLVGIDWPDYGVPRNLGRLFWLTLVEDIYTRGVKRISCQCMGGHGRTGVQLAILAHYLLPESEHKWNDAGELIQWVRDNMCVHEVEATCQQEYIAEVCDIPIGESKVHTSRWTGYSHRESNWNFDGTKWAQLQQDDDDHFLQGGGDAVIELDDVVKSSSSPTEEDDLVYECDDCDTREVRPYNHPLFDGAACIECGTGEMVDITDLPEVQQEIQNAIVLADIQAVQDLDDMESPKDDDTQEEE